MKNLVLAALALLLCLNTYAQTANSNLILFTENGERFFGILNGQRMNDEPVTNLKVQDLNQPSYTLKVIFENKSLGEMNKTVYLESGVEAVYAVKLDNKGNYKLGFRSSVPMAQAAPPAPQQQVVYWGAAPVVTQAVPVTTGTTTTTVREETVTTNGTGMNTNMNMGTGTGENVSMNVNTDGFGMNVNINTNGMGTGTTTGVTTGTAVTTTTVTTTTTGNVVSNPQPVIIANPQPVIVQPAPCMHMSSGDFNSALNSIKAKSFEDSKLTLAKQITSRNCVDAGQVKAIMETFGFEATKLEFAKYAYDYCWEKNNYFKVNDAFEFEMSIEELDSYISTR